LRISGFDIPNDTGCRLRLFGDNVGLKPKAARGGRLCGGWSALFGDIGLNVFKEHNWRLCGCTICTRCHLSVRARASVACISGHRPVAVLFGMWHI
jgi:hypothetical protein